MRNCCLGDKLTIGADPEFLMLKENLECRSAQGGGGIGIDGAGVAAEIRPAPSIHPLHVTHNIRTALLDGYHKSPSSRHLIWRAGSHGGHPIGGHIHLGTTAVGYGRADCNEIALFLDICLAFPTMLLDRRDEHLRRYAGGYGRLGDVRSDHSHGMEYRPLASWLTSPYVATAVLSVAKAVAVEFAYNHNNMMTVMGLHEDVLRVWCGADKDVKKAKRDMWPEIRGLLKTMHYYEDHPEAKPWIDYLINLVDSGRSWFPACSMKAAWGIPEDVSPELLRWVHRKPTVAEILDMIGV